MNYESVLEISGLEKSYRGGFTLRVSELVIPKGFSTALIGANGAGKTTLLDIVTGSAAYDAGRLKYFGNAEEPDSESIKERIGYCSASGFFPQDWRKKDVIRAMSEAYENFSAERFLQLLREFSVYDTFNKTVAKLSDGSKMRVCLAAVLARGTEFMILDEPGSTLDPLMRDRLCDCFRSYLERGGGNSSIVFSTHNIADMESAADYAVIMDKGRVIEKGFVEELKQKYTAYSADASDADRLRGMTITLNAGGITATGLALAEYSDRLNNAGALTETPGLQEISVELLRAEEVKRAEN